MKQHTLRKIAQIMGPDHLRTSMEERLCHGYDGGGRDYLPDAVAFPKTAEQISAILTLANTEYFPVVPRGAGSGMTGGALPIAGGLVLVTSRMHRILEIDRDNMICVVEPGVITGELQKEVKKYSLMYPPDPASLNFCTIGGNAAECAGGPSAVKYGVTRDYILGMEVVLPTGEIVRTGVRTDKSVTGYDLTRLLIGSEGTLGIFTKLTLRLLPLPEAKAVFLLTLDSLAKATTLVSQILNSGITPRTLEYMDRTAISVVGDRLEEPLPADTAALLLVELDGSPLEVELQGAKLTKFLTAQTVCFKQAADEREIDSLWQARRLVSPAVFSLRPHKISEDVVTPRSKIPDLVHRAEQLSRELDLIILTFGHAGDGNIHVNIMVDKNDSREYQNALLAREKLFQFVIELGGSLSGEHGIGTTKSRFLSLEIEPNALALMQRLKHFFDPANVLNPGKIFVTDNGDVNVP